MSDRTSRVLTLIISDDASRHLLLSAFFTQVKGGASRKDIDAWMSSQFHYPPGLIDLQQITEFLCNCYYAQRERTPYPDPPTQVLPLHPQREKAIQDTVPPAVIPLERKLLAYGGRRMVYIGEPDLDLILQRGVVFEGTATLINGRAGKCHSNCAHQWAQDRDGLSIVTGYALSEDGLWRQHSWLLRNAPRPRQRRLLETTIRRIQYFGAVLTGEEARIFTEAYEGLRFRI